MPSMRFLTRKICELFLAIDIDSLNAREIGLQDLAYNYFAYVLD